MSLNGHLVPLHSSTPKKSNQNISSFFHLQNLNLKPKPILFTNLISLALTVTLNSPLPSLAIPSPNSLSPILPSSTSASTPFSQSKNLPFGLENGKIRPCPSVNPSCVSTNPKSSSFSFPWTIPENSTDKAIQKLEEAIMKTQKNARIEVIEDTPNGKYLEAKIGGGFGQEDVIEFLVKGEVVGYRCMATNVNYVYPFTTAFGDSKGQEERMKKIIDELGWYAPSFDSMD
ncbi:thylakoid lumenal 17.9 kDa protein, chloroplastic [Euphorbia lathyris]|uniref:thylakoid lumenal 17.9 kDa protein, chloroplastic n=1 Tax=Euphorbia lathyris TaxID=212925 RepID=UPI00331348EB